MFTPARLVAKKLGPSHLQRVVSGSIPHLVTKQMGRYESSCAQFSSLDLQTRARRLRAAVTNSNNDSLKALLFMGSYFQPEMASPQFNEHDQTVSNRADLVKELTKSLENELEIKGFDYNELKELINFICQF